MEKLEKQILESATGGSSSGIVMKALEKEGVDINPVSGDTSVDNEKPFATEKEKAEIRSALRGKEGWKEVDFRLQEAVNELKGLENSGTDNKDPHIQELHKKIYSLKNEKFRGGRGTKAGPELGAAIQSALEEDTVEAASIENAQNEKDKLLGDLGVLRALTKEDSFPETTELRAEEIRRIQKRIVEINKTLPEVDPVEDLVKMEKAATEHREGKRVINETGDLGASQSVVAETAPPVQAEAENATLNKTETKETTMKFESSPLEFTMEEQPNTHNEKLARVEARIAEVAARQDELRGERGTAETEEKVELEKEATSLEEERQKIEESKPLQSAYDIAMDRIWKENEAKRAGLNRPAHAEQEPSQSAYAKVMDDRWAEIEATRKAAGQSTGEDLTLEPLSPKPVTQEEEISTPAGEVGPHIIVPAKTEQGPVTIEGTFTKIESTEIVPSLNTVEINSILTTEQIQQKKLENIRAKLDIMTGAVEARAEKAGMIDHVRSIGAMWNKVPKRYKYMLAAGALLSGVGAAAAGSAVALGAVGALGTALRGLSGAGLFVTFETMLKTAHEKKTGEERSKATETRHMLLASLGAVAFAALLPKAISEYMGSEALPTGTHEAPVHTPSPKIEFTVEKGDTLWGGIEDKLDTQGLSAGMQEGQKTYMIDALKDKFAAMSPAELKAIGITSGNIDIIHPGDHIDLTKVLGDTSSMHDVVSHAQGLSPEQISSIEHPQTPAPEAPHEAVAAHAPTPESTTIVPREISPEILAAANSTTTDFYNQVLGTKGLWGIGALDGTKMLDWTDPVDGFAKKSVDEIIAARPSAFPNPEVGGTPVGINNFGAREKMIAAFKEIFEKTGVAHLSGETPIDYSNRAAVTALTQGTFEGQN